ncbi:MAG: hypothetical protein QM651_01105 [Rhodoblastus sp.]
MKFATVAVCLVSIALAAPARAASTAFLSSAGSGSSCTPAAPCVNMDTAISAAGAGGEVVCLDKFKYGSASAITASVTISCGDGLWDTSLPLVNVNTPAGSRVVIEGLVGDCLGLNCGTILNFNGQGALELRRVSIGNSGGTIAHALLFAPNGSASLTVSDSHFYDMPLSGIQIQPVSGGSANVYIRNTRFSRNQNGINANGSGSTGGITVNIVDSAVSGSSGNGITASTPGSGAPVTISVMNSQVSGNHNGLRVSGPSASGRGSAAIAVFGSQITANANGLSASALGQILTHGNNQLRFNTNDGAFTGNIGLQ